MGEFAPVPLMFQFGYLTVSEVKWHESRLQHTLKVPNSEVFSSLLSLLTCSDVDSSKVDEIKRLAMNIRAALISMNPTALEVAFHNLLSRIPYKKIFSFEGYCLMALFLALNSIEQRVELKNSTSDGTSEAIVTIDEDVFVMKFKRVEAEEETDESDGEVAFGRGKRKKPPKKKSSPDHLTEMLNKTVSEAIKRIEGRRFADRDLCLWGTGRAFIIAAVVGRTKVKTLFKEIERPDDAKV
ncbi:MAG: hypothetical protein LBJ64_08505 [Deltaproteobacteria bacterium]|nr:hypothetical protein [Deltaproteobacteria bacterium]